MRRCSLWMCLRDVPAVVVVGPPVRVCVCVCVCVSEYVCVCVCVCVSQMPRDRDKDRDKDRDRHRHRDKDRDTETLRDRHAETDRHTHTHLTHDSDTLAMSPFICKTLSPPLDTFHPTSPSPSFLVPFILPLVFRPSSLRFSLPNAVLICTS